MRTSTAKASESKTTIVLEKRIQLPPIRVLVPGLQGPQGEKGSQGDPGKDGESVDIELKPIPTSDINNLFGE